MEYERRELTASSRKRIQHAVSLKRIEKNVKDIGTMIHISDGKLPTDVIIPKDLSDELGVSEETLLRLPSRYKPSRSVTKETHSPLKSLFHSSKTKSSDNIETESLDYSPHFSRSTSEITEFSDDSDSDIGEYGIVGESMKQSESKINLDKINKLMNKIDEAMHDGDLSEKEEKESARRSRLKFNKKMSKMESSSYAQMIDLERRLATAVKKVFHLLSNGEKDKVTTPKPLTNRFLQPYYQLKDVERFFSIFHEADQDYSGELDPDEWIKFFSTFRSKLPHYEAQVLFLKLDTKDRGVISIRDIVSLVFDKASKEQIRSILFYCETEEMRRCHRENDTISAVDVENLFDLYDTDTVGFVSINLIRNRISTLALSHEVESFLTESMTSMADDDMVNLTEFSRIFQVYLSNKKFEAHKIVSKL